MGGEPAYAIREAVADDTPGIARVSVDAWRSTGYLWDTGCG
ncbi:MAG: hypothetical protein ACYC4R_09300 [Anaerolineae bacterium]